MPLRERLPRCTPDHAAAARWCVRGAEKLPDRWARRHHWIRREGRLFAPRRPREIVDAIRRLFERGLVTRHVESAAAQD